MFQVARVMPSLFEVLTLYLVEVILLAWSIGICGDRERGKSFIVSSKEWGVRSRVEEVEEDT
jgi:hypothetical protein